MPEVEYESEVKVQKPLTQAWNVFMDDSLLSQWLIGYKSSEALEGSRNISGSKLKLTMNNSGKETIVVQEITEVKNNECFKFSLSHTLLSSHNEIIFTSLQKDLTVIRGRSKVRAKGLILKSMFPLMKKKLARQNEASFLKLKELIEKIPH